MQRCQIGLFKETKVSLGDFLTFSIFGLLLVSYFGKSPFLINIIEYHLNNGYVTQIQD